MALRGFGDQTLTGSPQALFGTTLSAAVMPSPDLYTGGLDPRSNNSLSVLSLNSPVNLFRAGDHVMVGASNTFIQGNTTPVDGGMVQQVNQSASNIIVTGLQRKHSASDWVVLALPVSQVLIQVSASNTGAQIYLGEDPTVASNSATLIAAIPKNTVQPPFSIPSGAGGNFNAIETQKLWVTGTASDTFLPSLLTI